MKDITESTGAFALLVLLVLGALAISAVLTHQAQNADVLDGLSTDAQAGWLAHEQSNSTLLIVIGGLVCLGVPGALLFAVALWAVAKGK